MPDMIDGTTFPEEFRVKATAKASSPSETQLTLQKLEREILSRIVDWNRPSQFQDTPEETAAKLAKYFTQALTTVRNEMEKKKKTASNSDYDNFEGLYFEHQGYNQAISECQKLLEQIGGN